MQQILVYADSLCWGIVPGTRRRLPFAQRWPGVLETALRQNLDHNAGGAAAVRVIENCLNGRRTVWDDPFKPGRDGRQGLAQQIEMHSPLRLVIVMLGSNDFQSTHQHNAWHSAQGIRTLVQLIRQAPIEPDMPRPDVMIMAPPRPRPVIDNSDMAEKFRGAADKCEGLARAYQSVCHALGCDFFDADALIQTSATDGVHLDAAEHGILGKALVPAVIKYLMSRAEN